MPLIPKLAEQLDVPLGLPAGGPEVAITFDDGPHPEGTPEVLRILAERNAVATFFLVGERVEAAPALAAEIVAAGGALVREPQPEDDEPPHLAMCVDTEGNEFMLSRKRTH
jgi:peptidoglycan/xylan/chitin deacetylase (PgdA/CDA1 family)